MIIRKKEKKDCEAWIDINITSWNDNLKGVVSDNLLKIIRDGRDSRIKEDKNFVPNDNEYVLEDNNKVIGIMKLRQCDKDGFKDCGEIQMLYLYTSEKGKGYGRALINKGFEILREKGYKKAIIGCLDNNPSNEFYKHMGCIFVRQDPWTIFDETYMENIYEFKL